MKRKQPKRRKHSAARKLTELKAFLAARNLTQAEFAKSIGVTQGAVWQWIAGEQRVSAERVFGIEDATDGAVTRYQMRPDLFKTEARA